MFMPFGLVAFFGDASRLQEYPEYLLHLTYLNTLSHSNELEFA